MRILAAIAFAALMLLPPPATAHVPRGCDQQMEAFRDANIAALRVMENRPSVALDPEWMLESHEVILDKVAPLLDCIIHRR
ncbi:MAG: hypothetical protein F4X35_04375 [Alphaproteobacteria bacterium]|nr:hypothetical protein [Alphaproteobacteria bacterium]